LVCLVGLKTHKPLSNTSSLSQTLISRMSWFPLVYISSDDSTDDEISYCSDSEELSAGWSGYFPPSAATATSTNMRSNKKISAAPDPSLEVDSSSSSEGDDPTYTLSKELPQALTTALKSAINNMKWPEPSKPAKDLKPPPQVLGLACPRKQLSFDEKRKKASKGKHDYEGKGKKPME
jgi:hypothetical protein